MVKILNIIDTVVNQVGKSAFIIDFHRIFERETVFFREICNQSCFHGIRSYPYSSVLQIISDILDNKGRPLCMENIIMFHQKGCLYNLRCSGGYILPMVSSPIFAHRHEACIPQKKRILRSYEVFSVIQNILASGYQTVFVFLPRTSGRQLLICRLVLQNR